MKTRSYFQTLSENEVTSLTNDTLDFLKDVVNKREAYRTNYPEKANDPVSLQGMKLGMDYLQQYYTRLKELQNNSK